VSKRVRVGDGRHTGSYRGPDPIADGWRVERAADIPVMSASVPRATPVRVAGLDALRGVAVLLVMLNHQRFIPGAGWLTGGWLGVDLFFSLSGFLIGWLLLREYTRTGGISYRAFWVRRAARLVPALLVFLTIWTAVVCSPTPVGSAWADPMVVGTSRSEVLAGGWAATLSGLQNWWLSLGLPYPFAFGHLWSLAVEWQFYAIVPVLLLTVAGLVQGRLSRERMIGMLVMLAVASGAIHAAVTVTRGTDYGYIDTFGRAPALLAGVIAACALSPHLPGAPRTASQRVVRWLLPVTVVALVCAWLVAPQGAPAIVAVGIPAVGVLSGLVVWLVASVEWHGLVVRVLAWFGQRSYSAYLYNMPIVIAVAVGVPSVSPAGRVALVWMLTWLAAVMSWSLVERRTLTSRKTSAVAASPVEAG
jgi:peptidoglycan/LPS O-acetylase OafA/YrhL